MILTHSRWSVWNRGYGKISRVLYNRVTLEKTAIAFKLNNIFQGKFEVHVKLLYRIIIYTIKNINNKIKKIIHL